MSLRGHRAMSFLPRVILVLGVVVVSALPVAAQEGPAFQGRGQQATGDFALPAPDSMITFTHDGSRNFIVHGYVGDRVELLVNQVGAYAGTRPLRGDAAAMLDIQADGNWSATVAPIPEGGTLEWAGTGDAVSPWFTPPARATLALRHDGNRNFIVHANCAGGPVLVQNEIGPVDASRVVLFRSGPCFWEVQADGTWSVTPG